MKLRKSKSSRNEIVVDLLKIEGNSVFSGKGKYNTETTLCVEKTGTIRKHFSRYHINPLHIKRYPYGTGLIFIDLSTHKSFNPHTEEKDIKTINQIQYVTQSANWEAHQNKMKMNRWQTLIVMFAGMGLLFLILEITGVIRGVF
jgi:hypothetical protein